MITMTLETPDCTIHTAEFDPNELDALRQAILLGLDDATDAGLETGAARALAFALGLHC